MNQLFTSKTSQFWAKTALFNYDIIAQMFDIMGDTMNMSPAYVTSLHASNENKTDFIPIMYKIIKY